MPQLLTVKNVFNYTMSMDTGLQKKTPIIGLAGDQTRHAAAITAQLSTTTFTLGLNFDYLVCTLQQKSYRSQLLNMVNKCCAPGCRSSYAGKNSIEKEDGNFVSQIPKPILF
jgi:hypothetical protein